jgi:hypothetical protein
MHGGCGNTNGVKGCSTFCQNLGLTINAGWTIPCGSGYPSGINAVVADGSPSRTHTCMYRNTDVAAGTGYIDYAQAATCPNSMSNCVCDL